MSNVKKTVDVAYCIELQMIANKEVKPTDEEQHISDSEWKKRVGKIESAKCVFDVHWYELDYKQYRMKLKYRGKRK